MWIYQRRRKHYTKKKEYLESIAVLESIKPRSDEVIYWIWENEGAVGTRASVFDAKEKEESQKYHEYVKAHSDYFYRIEYIDGYLTTLNRYDEISTAFPTSEYAGTMFFHIINADYCDEDCSSHMEIMGNVRDYQTFINRYPDHPKAKDISQELEWEEEILKNILYEDYEEDETPIRSQPLWDYYDSRYIIDREAFIRYLKMWLQSGQYRAFDVEIRGWGCRKPSLDIFASFDIPNEGKRKLKHHLNQDQLVAFSVAAFKNKNWKGPKYLFFDRSPKYPC